MRKLFAAGAGLALAFSATHNVHAQSKEPVKLGLIEPLSGPIAAVGTDVLRAFQFAAANVNKRGGVLGGRMIEIVPLDNAMNAEKTTQQLQNAVGMGLKFVTQGVGSNHALNIIKFLNKHNRRNPGKRMLYLNNSAVTTAFTNKLCSFWHFRFDANVDQKVAGLVTQMAKDPKVTKIYMINQNYAYGKSFAAAAQRLIKARAKNAKLVGAELIVPFGKVKDFTPYISKIKASGADTVLTGNWGPDLTRFVKAAAAAGLNVQFYTIYAGIPSSIAGYGLADGKAVNIKQIAEYHEDGRRSPEVAEFAKGYRERYGSTWNTDRYRMLIEMFAAALNKAGSDDPVKVGYALEGITLDNGAAGVATMRATDHQIHMPMVVATITDSPKTSFVYNGKDFKMGWKTDAWIDVKDLTLPTTCKMRRPKR